MLNLSLKAQLKLTDFSMQYAISTEHNSSEQSYWD